MTTSRSAFHVSRVSTLAAMFFTLLIPGPFITHARADSAVPNIQLNGMDGTVTLTSGSTLLATVQLEAGDQAGERAEWWIVVETPMGWYYYAYPDGWYMSQEGMESLVPAYEGPLFTMTEPLEVLRMAQLPTGTYRFYFGVDTVTDGLMDLNTMVYDVSQLEVVETEDGSFPVVDTDQGTCYDDSGPIPCPDPHEPFHGQDAQYAGDAPVYTDNGDGTVTDHVTGLMWQQSPDINGDGNTDADDKLTYNEAVAFASTFSLGGYTDWRLPTIKELYSLILFSGTDPSGYEGTDTTGLLPFIDTRYFNFAYGDTSSGERIIDSQWVTSTLYEGTVMGGLQAMFGVNFADGRIKGYPVSDPTGGEKTFYVRLCRGSGGYGQNSLVAKGDETITDNATGLMWMQNDSGTGLNWEEALAWVETRNAANFLGYGDWRLPNAKELQSIVDYGRSPDTTDSAAIDPLFNATAITNEAGQADYPYYWTGTTHANWTATSGANAAYIAFGRAMGYMNGAWIDVHGAGAQRSDPKVGDPADYPTGHGPQGDAIRIYNYVRMVRDANGS